VPFRSTLEKAMYEVDQMERRAQFFRDAALLHASLGNTDKAREMFQLYAENTFPELISFQSDKDAKAEEILKRLPASIPMFPAVSFSSVDVLSQRKVAGAGLNEPSPDTKIDLRKT
jgi:hypothetical protein